MAVSAFDILTATHSLESSGVPRAQAESITDTVRQGMEALVAGLATKDDLAALGAATKADIDTLRAETKADIDTLRAETKADIDTLRADMNTIRTEMKTEMKAIRTETKDMATKSDLATLRAELFRAIWLQSISIFTGVGVLLTILRIF